MKNWVLSSALAASLFVGSDQGHASVPEIKPASDFQGISYNVTSSGTVVVVVGVREFSGKVAICGVVWFEQRVSNTTKVIETKITDKIKFTINGKSLRVNTRLFRRYDSEEDAKSGVARCSVTQVPWVAAYSDAKVNMALSRGTVTE